MRMLSFKDTDHLGCIDCMQFTPSSFYNMEEGECKGKLLEFCRRHFDARL
jgi:hypothetical protein